MAIKHSTLVTSKSRKVKEITADGVTLHQQDNVVVAEGNVTFNDGQVEARSDRVTSDIDQDTFSLENTDYHFILPTRSRHGGLYCAYWPVDL
ncbi:LptA/OstA family protein [Vibrio sp. M60_M31a]